MSEVIKDNSTIIHLCLGCTQMDSIMKATLILKFYYYITIIVNFVGPQGAKSLSLALKVNTSLMILDLQST